MAREAVSRSRGGRRGSRDTSARKGIQLPPWKLVQNPYAPNEILSPEQLDMVHDTSMRILEEIGIKVLDAEAREYFRKAGAKVDESSQIVFIDRVLVDAKVATAPAQFTLKARNAAKNIVVGGNHHVFTSVGGPAFVSDLDKGRRPGTYAELCDYLRIIQSLDIIHQEGGGPFEPLDLSEHSRHLDIYYAQYTLLDKTSQPIALGRERTLDAIEMAKITHGQTTEEMIAEPSLMTVINTNSPLVIDDPMCEGLIELARHGQAAIVTPFTLAGAMSPITLPGALAQQNAEALAGIVLTQCVREGAPVVYGGFTSNVDMKTGSPAFGTPEYTYAANVTGQLARRYGVPFRSSVATSSNAVDAQAAYESQMSLWGAVMGHANVIIHAAGWLNAGLTASFEKLIIDAEALQMMSAYLTPPEINEETLAFDAIKDVQHAGHFFGTPHTMERYETAFYSPMVSDRTNFDAWQEEGSLTTEQRANGIWKKLLEEYQQPEIDTGIDDALKDYVERRKREIAS